MLPVVLNRLFNLRGAGVDGVGLGGAGKWVVSVGGSKSSSSSERMVG